MLIRYLIGYSPISLNNIALPIVFRESYKRLDNLTEAMAIEIDIEQKTYRFLLKYPYPLPPYDYVNIYILGAAAGCRLYAYEGSEPLFGVSVKDNRKYWFNVADKTSKPIMDYLKNTAVEVETGEDFKFLTREVEGGNT